MMTVDWWRDAYNAFAFFHAFQYHIAYGLIGLNAILAGANWWTLVRLRRGAKPGFIAPPGAKVNPTKPTKTP